MRSTIVILTMVSLSTLVRFFQESRSNKAAERLKEMASNTATVLRQHMDKDLEEFVRECFGLAPSPKGPRKLELPIKRLVPGDIVLLTAGDMVPADLRVLSAKDLFINQAALTGESMPVEKFAMPGRVTPTLAKETVMLSKKQVIVKRLDAIQNLGAMDLLCKDKTGTITQDRVHLERCTDAFGEVSEVALFYAYLNSSFQTGLKSLIDAAILEKANTAEKTVEVMVLSHTSVHVLRGSCYTERR